MSPRSKKEYVEALFLRYKRASCKERSIILDEFCATCGYHRKHAIRLLRKFKRFAKPKLKKRGRSPVYHRNRILKPLKDIWLAANLPCSKRLKVILPLCLPGYLQSFGPLSPETSQALLSISPSTIDRLLLPTRIQYQKRGIATTKPSTLIRYCPCHLPPFVWIMLLVGLEEIVKDLVDEPGHGFLLLELHAVEFSYVVIADDRLVHWCSSFPQGFMFPVNFPG